MSFYRKNPDIISNFLNEGHLSHFGIYGLNKNVKQLLSVDPQFSTAIFFALTGATVADLKYKLKVDNKLIDQLKCIDKIRCTPIPTSKAELKLLYNEINEENISLYHSYLAVMCDRDIKNRIKAFHNDIIENCEPFCLGHLSVDGNDISALGVKGEKIGIIINSLLKKVIEAPELNSKENLIKLAEKIL